ncbi:MAG: TMEM165/GDT1 family protein [Planctomycetota bacterium]
MSSWWGDFGAAFALVFVAELGDKTQLAVLGLAASRSRPAAVLSGAAVALVLSTLVAVGVGLLLRLRLDPRWLHYGAAALFLGLGLFMLFRGPSWAAGATPPP